MMRRQSLFVLGMIGVLTSAGAQAADPVDMVLYTENGSNAGLWRAVHTELPPGSFYNPEGHVDRAGSVVFTDPNLDPNPNLPLIGDVNGDGLADMVRVGYDSNSNADVFVASHSYDPTFGGGYGVINTLGTNDSWWPAPASAIDYHLGDVDGDGTDDAIAVKDGGWPFIPDGPNATIWEVYLSSSGGLGFNGTSYCVRGATTNEHLVGDFNGDGLTDIAERTAAGLPDPQGWIFAFLTGPDGFIGDPTVSDIVQGAVNLDNEDSHVATLVGDINGDGLDDIIDVDDRSGDGDWVFVCGLTAANGDPSGFGIAAGGVSWASPFDVPPAGLTRQIARIGDMNGDGYEDLVLYREYVESGLTYGQWLVSYTDPSVGDLSASELSDSATIRHQTGVNDGCVPLLAQLGPPIPPEDCSNGIDDDFDFLVDCEDPHCDLSPDCVCYGPEDDTVLFNASDNIGAGNWFMSHTLCAADHPPFYNGNPAESVSYFNDVTLLPNPNRPLVGDVNGDGLDDMVRVADNGFQEVFVASNTYDAGYGIGMLGLGYADSFVGLNSASYAFFVGDVNNDGYDDAIAAQPNDNPGIDGGDPNTLVWSCYHSGDSGFGLFGYSWSAFGRVELPAGGGTTTSPTTPLTGDFNGDGHTDIGFRFPVDADTTPGWILCALSDANGLNPIVSVGQIVQGFVGNEANHVATLVGDINGDGLDDIVEVDDRYDNGQWVWVAGLTGASAEPSGLAINVAGLSWTTPFGPPNPGTTLQVPLLADLNGDGFDDLVMYWEYPQAHDFGDTIGQWLVAYTDPATGDLFNSVFNDSGTVLIPDGYEGNIPLTGTFDLPMCSLLPSDLTGDGDVDLLDLHQFQQCYTGPGDPAGVFGDARFRCRCLDTGDGDVDIEEYLILESCLNGPGMAPACD